MSLALNEFLNLGYSIETCGQIAHKVEISLGGGLGDVIAQTGKGLVLRTLPGAPGIGEIKSFNEDVYVACKSFGDISRPAAGRPVFPRLRRCRRPRAGGR